MSVLDRRNIEVARPPTDTAPLPAPLLVDAREAARMLGMSTRSLDRVIAAGRLRAVRVGGLRRFRPEDLRRFVDDVVAQDAPSAGEAARA
jgi:excisionase family DNA binding protein